MTEAVACRYSTARNGRLRDAGREWRAGKSRTRKVRTQQRTQLEFLPTFDKDAEFRVPVCPVYGLTFGDVDQLLETLESGPSAREATHVTVATASGCR